MALKAKSFFAFFGTFCSYFSVFLSNPLKFRSKGLTEKVLAGFWLIASVVILAFFSGSLYERLIRGQPIESLESMDQLLQPNSHWSRSKMFVVVGVGEFDRLTTGMFQSGDNQTSLEHKLFKRSEIIDPMEILFDLNFTKQLFLDIMEKNDVLSLNKLHIYYYLNNLKSLYPELVSQYVEGIDYYISQTTVSSPYFLLTYENDFEKDYRKSLNIMYVFIV